MNGEPRDESFAARTRQPFRASYLLMYGLLLALMNGQYLLSARIMKSRSLRSVMGAQTCCS